MYNSKIIIALDFSNKIDALQFLDKFNGKKLFVKIGMELFYKEGPSIVTEIKKRGHNVFLDLKLYDIPTTVSKAIHSLAALDVDMLTIHTSGGDMMLKEAQKVADEYNINLLGVTILTSQDKSELLATNYELVDIINDLALKAKRNSLYGIICSGADIPNFDDSLHDLQFITPGIRLTNDNNDDQKRVATPTDAIANGANFLVIGRSITNANDPVSTYQKIQKMIGEENE